MIIIEKKKSNEGTVYYELTDSATLATRRWFPPKRLLTNQKYEILETLCTTFQEELLTTQQPTPIEPAEPIEQLPSQDLDTTDISFYDFCEQVFLPFKRIKISANTVDRWQSKLNSRLYPQFKSRKLKDITALQLNDFLLGLQFVGLACSTVVTYHTLLKSIFGMAHFRGAVSTDPMTFVPKPTPRKNEMLITKPAYFPPETMAHIEECAKNEPLRWQAFIWLMSDTGVRRGECCGLLWRNVDFKRNQITIDGALYYTKAKGIFRDTTKNRKSRTLSVSEKTMKMLLTLHTLNMRSFQSEYVFTQCGSGKPINPTTVTKYFSIFGKKYGIPGMHPHKFRHTFASVAIEAGADVASVSEILGHSDTSVTLNVYTSTDQAAMKHTANIYRNRIEAAKQL